MLVQDDTAQSNAALGVGKVDAKMVTSCAALSGAPALKLKSAVDTTAAKLLLRSSGGAGYTVAFRVRVVTLP